MTLIVGEPTRPLSDQYSLSATHSLQEKPLLGAVKRDIPSSAIGQLKRDTRGGGGGLQKDSSAIKPKFLDPCCEGRC